MPNDEPSQSQSSDQQIAPEGVTGDVHFKEVAHGPWEDISGQIPPAVVTALDRIAPEIAAARELKEVHALVSSLAGVRGLDAITGSSLRDSLTNRGGGFRVGAGGSGQPGSTPLEGPLGKVPGRSRGGSGHLRYQPGASIRTGGLTRQGGGPQRIEPGSRAAGGPQRIEPGSSAAGGPQRVESGGQSGSIYRGSDGTVVVKRNFADGTTVTTVVVATQDGEVTRTETHRENPDGSSSTEGTVNHEDGGRTEYEKHVDADGNATSERQQTYDADGNPVGDPASQPGVDGEGYDSDLARHFRAWHSAVYGPRVVEFSVPALVNPGTADNADAAHAPTGGINLGDSLVINPDPDRAGGPGGGLSPEAAQRMKERLKDGGTPGPNPGPRPGE